MERQEFLQWAKDRALAYVKHGDYRQAITSLMSDFTKHEAFSGNPAYSMLFIVALQGKEVSNATECEKFINGFN